MYGQRKAFQNLCDGLRRAGITYEVNSNIRRLLRNGGPVGVFGQRDAFLASPDKLELIAGPAICAHPYDIPRLLEDFNVRCVLSPGPWNTTMWKEYWGCYVHTWPVGIDTERWQPGRFERGRQHMIIYDKLMWLRSADRVQLISQIEKVAARHGWTFSYIRYGAYNERFYRKLLSTATGMLFLCEHETQGIAYQQALACGVPLLAWESPCATWRDPRFFPHRVIFSPVTSTPYWDDRCGDKFSDLNSFENSFALFTERVLAGKFSPRSFVLEHLDLVRQAKAYAQWFE
jgi:hypothetical protein